MMLIKLHNNQTPPVRLNIAQVDCHLISETLEDSIVNMDSYFENFPMKLPDFRLQKTIDDRIKFIEEQIGKQFLAL